MIKQPQSSHETLRRRLLLGGTTALSATAVALLAGAPAWAATKTAARHDPSRDAAVLNTALALEYEGINAYTLGAQSNLLEKAGGQRLRIKHDRRQLRNNGDGRGRYREW